MSRRDPALPTIQRPSDRWLPVLLLLFVGSGAAALIYEIVWFQLLQLVIGSSSVSLGVLLGTFMGGMCLGSLLLPRLVSPRHHPLKVYALLELGIGVIGILVLLLMPLATYLYTAWGGYGLTGFLLRGVVAGVLLLPPTLEDRRRGRGQSPTRAGRKPMKNGLKATGLGGALVALVVMVSVDQAGGAAAQTPPAGAPPAPAQAAAPTLPPGATIAFVNTAAVAGQSKLGQSFAAELDALREAKNKELNAKRAELQAAQQKLQDALSMTETARAELQRDIDRLGRELQFMTDNAQAEMANLQADVQRRFDAALGPVLDKVAAAHNLQLVFSLNESGLVWASPSLNLTAEVIQAIDAGGGQGQ